MNNFEPLNSVGGIIGMILGWNLVVFFPAIIFIAIIQKLKSKLSQS